LDRYYQRALVNYIYHWMNPILHQPLIGMKSPNLNIKTKVIQEIIRKVPLSITELSEKCNIEDQNNPLYSGKSISS